MRTWSGTMTLMAFLQVRVAT